MNAKAGGLLLLGLMVLVGIGRADEPRGLLPPVVVDDDANENVAGKDKPKPPEEKKKLPEPPKFDPFPVTSAVGDFAMFNPHMMGDFPGSFARRTVTLVGLQTTTITTVTLGEGKNTTTTTTTSVPTARTITVLVPIGSTGSFKVADNESPRPVDRVFFTWNYFSNIRDPQGAAISPFSSQVNTATVMPLLTTMTSVNTSIPGLPRTSANLHREVFGFEKTFLDGNASIELRVPLLQQASNIDGFSSRDIGDLTVLGKYAFLLDRDTGNVFSAGLAVTAPTGPQIAIIDGNLHSTLLQPWFGYIWNSDRFFVQAFHSVVIPTDSRDVTLLFNDVGLNYWLYRGGPNRPISFIVPTAEIHVTTPLNHRDGNGPIYVPDLVDLTGGVHIGLGRNATLSFGVATPVTAPRVFNVEAFAQFNWRF